MKQKHINLPIRGGLQGECGAAAVEFGFVLPILVILVLGLSDIGLYFQRALQLNTAIEAGVLYVTSYVSQNGWTPSNPNSASDIQTIIQKAVGMNTITVSTPTCDFRCVSNNQVGDAIIACLKGNGQPNAPVPCSGTEYLPARYVTITASLSANDTFLSSALLNLSGYNLYPITRTTMIRTP